MSSRFEDTHRGLPVGTLCHTEYRDQRVPYVFVGWRTNTAGCFAVFSRVHEGEYALGAWGMEVGLLYSAAMTDTIRAKFPDLPERADAEA